MTPCPKGAIVSRSELSYLELMAKEAIGGVIADRNGNSVPNPRDRNEQDRMNESMWRQKLRHFRRLLGEVQRALKVKEVVRKADVPVGRLAGGVAGKGKSRPGNAVSRVARHSARSAGVPKDAERKRCPAQADKLSPRRCRITSGKGRDKGAKVAAQPAQQNKRRRA